MGWGPAPFKFELYWMKEKGFKDLIAAWWAEDILPNRKCFVLHLKLKWLKAKLKSWCTTTFGSLSESLATILSGISQIDLSKQGLYPRRRLLFALTYRSNIEPRASKMKLNGGNDLGTSGLKRGDKNTRFFHAVASAHRRINGIRSLSVGNSIVTSKEDIISIVLNHFQQLYSANSYGRLPIAGLPFRSISDTKASSIEQPFSEDEIRDVWDLSEDCAPGSDGFPIAFFKSF